MLEKHFYTWELEAFPIPDTYGLGFSKELDGVTYISVGSYSKENFREANVSISSYVGCIGAQHYYCNIKIYVNIEEYSTGYGVFKPGLDVPAEFKSLNLELKRPIEKFELERKIYDPAFYKENSLVHGFYTVEEIVTLFKEIAPKIFKGKWEIDCDFWDHDEKILINN